MTNHTTRIGFASSQTIPPVEVAVVELSSAQVLSYNDLHERFVDTLTQWARETIEGQMLVNEIDGPVTVGAILMALDTLTTPSLEFWLVEAGLFGFQVMAAEAVYDLDESVAE